MELTKQDHKDAHKWMVEALNGKDAPKCLKDCRDDGEKEVFIAVKASLSALKAKFEDKE